MDLFEVLPLIVFPNRHMRAVLTWELLPYLVDICHVLFQVTLLQTSMTTYVTGDVPNLLMLVFHMGPNVTFESRCIVAVGTLESLVLPPYMHSLDVLIEGPPKHCCVWTLITFPLLVFLLSMLSFDVRF